MLPSLKRQEVSDERIKGQVRSVDQRRKTAVHEGDHALDVSIVRGKPRADDEGDDAAVYEYDEKRQHGYVPDDVDDEAVMSVRQTEPVVKFIKSTLTTCNYCGAVIGISGGIDSAVVATLAVEAIGRDHVLGILLPERDSSPDTEKDSLLVCDFLGIDRIVKPITKGLAALGAYRLVPSTRFIPRSLQERYVRNRIKKMEGDVFLKDLMNSGDELLLKGSAFYRSKHRLRMVCLYMEAEQRGYAVLGSTNRTEAVTGFYVKWGDDSSDIEPILHLYKTQVFELARELGIPERIQNKAPTPDLLPGILDEQMLGMPYHELDAILMAMDGGAEMTGMDDTKIERVGRILKAVKIRKIRNLALNKDP